MSGGPTHTDVAAYVLGVLDDADNALFEAHLLDCPHCQLDLLELQDLPGVLDRVRQTWPNPPLPAPRAPVLHQLLDATAEARRKGRRTAKLVAAAAVLLIIAGPLVTLAVLASASPGTPYAGVAPPPAATTQAPPATSGPESSSGPPEGAAPPPSTAPSSPSPTVKGGHVEPGGPPEDRRDPHLLSQGSAAVAAKVSVKRREWGSRVDLQLEGVTGPLRCQLLAVTNEGTAWVVVGWAVPAKGYGVPASPKPLRLSGGTALSPEEIDHFEIRSDDGALLTSVSP
ncbi:zf-HC2 domain-containing protein [Prauserella muralis]|uniref:Putative zinc-finger domain-containing protein n=1 Tax=Prauserella muralis TaxID=588067 RepID=A0A2V4BEZ4_9PSEU|nr:zf-HC2 domain-containing protein [Prauserella muralis]PXY28179.1 hypothetical protein BAY60_17780 [Prauserella muralis]TWE22007.1 putative zinc finger protein [Prauserella muralis]